MAGLLGGLKNLAGANSGEAEKCAKFAVKEHNDKQNSGLSFTRLVSAEEQVVQGKLYHLTIEVKNNDKTENYKAKVWVKPWENHRSLESFELLQSS